MDFSAWIVSGLMLVAGATWLIVYNADVLLGVAMRVPGPDPRARAGAQDGDGLSRCATRFRTGRHARHVHARRVHDRRRCDDLAARSCAPSTTSERFGGGFDVTRRGRAARARSASRDRDPRRRAGSRRLPRRRQRVGRCRPRRPAGRRRGRRGATRVRGFDDSFLLHHDVRPRRARDAATARRARSGTRCRRRPTSPWSTRSPRRVAPTGASASPPDLPPARLLHRGRDVRPGAGRGPRPAHSGRPRTLTVIGVLADTVPLDMAGAVDLAADGGDVVRRDARRPDHPPPRARPRRGPGRAAAAARARVPRQRHGGQVGRERASTRPSARRTRSTGCCSASWASGWSSASPRSA